MQTGGTESFCVEEICPRECKQRSVMTDSPQWKGTCRYCGTTYAKGGMVQHLGACADREDAVDGASHDDSHETFYHLRADVEWSRPFWLDLELRGSAPLEELDAYLRAIWLECCGHLSQFTIGGFRGREIPESHRADQVFHAETQLTHLYDFGTTSETRIRVMDVRRGPPTTERPIALMARNEMPEITCMKCNRQATWLCPECAYETGQAGHLCDEHLPSHPHDADGDPFPLVNSPRTGMCGYTGPAEPPY